MKKLHYFLPPGYTSRPTPEYFVDENLNAVWQPDVYPEAAALARRLGAGTIVDVGCGTAGKLAELHPEFDVVGIDFGSNIEFCRAHYGFGTWIETDFDRDSSLGYDDLDRSVLVCADVIEHLVRPERLLRMLRLAFDAGTSALLLSTPERELHNEPDPLGPPLNPAHVREWASDELRQFMASEGLEGHFGLTRSNDVMPYMQTILAVIPANREVERKIVANWWQERQKWERLAVEQDRTIAELTSWTRELQTASDWHQQEMVRWQQNAQDARARLAELGVEPEERSPPSIAAAPQEAEPQGAARSSALVTVLTEVDNAETALEAVAAQIAAQSFSAWQWTIVTTDEAVDVPVADERIRVVLGPSRAQALRAAVADAAEFVVLLDSHHTLPPTALEKWLWFLEAHPECAVVGGDTAKSGPRMVRRTAIERYGSLDAAFGAEAAGFVPEVESGSADESGLRLPRRNHSPNAWLPEELPFRNRRETGDRRHLLLIAPWMTLGGADKYNLDLLAQLARHGWSASVATTLDGSHEWYPHYERLTTDLFPLPHFLRLVDYPRFLRYLVASRCPDVVLVSNSELGYRLLPYLRGMSPSTTLADFCHSEIEDWNNGGYPRFSIEYQESLDLTITASEHLRSWMIVRGGRPERIEVSHANVDTGTWRPLPEARGDIRRELGLAKDEPIVLFAGRLAGEKQPRVLAETFALLAGTGARFTGVVVGEGPDRGWLERFVRNRGLQDRVRLLGALGPDQMLGLMAGSDILFVPSKVEGIALTFYEALACGVPVVGARVGGQAELVTDEVGVLIERSTPEDEALRYAEVLASLLADSGRRRSMGLAARALVETLFPLERMGERMNDLLERAIELHASAPGPVPSKQLARATATEAVELIRVAEMVDWLSGRLATDGLRSIGTAMYFALRRVGAPLYLRSLRRGSRVVPRLKSIAQRLLVGEPL